MTLFTIPTPTKPASDDAWVLKSIACCLFLLFLFIWFYMLGARTLVPTDEARYAEIAREMAQTGDFITPRLNGIRYFGKPPLQAWMNALTFMAFGVGEWQARLWTGLCGLLGIFMVFLAGRRVYDTRTGFAAALVLGSSFYWAASGHVNSYDMSLSAMMSLALCAMLIAQRADAALQERRNWMLVCWAGMALAVMSKGLVGIVLPGAVLTLYTLISRDRQIWRRLHFAPGLAIFIAITAPWFLLISIRNPEFLHFFFIREHVLRFTSSVHLRSEPWHYFIPYLALGVMPWLGVLGQSLRYNLRYGACRASAGFQPDKLLAIWAIFIFVFFSVSTAKLPSYILPIFPALALIIARYLESASHKAIVAAAGMFGLFGAAALAYLSTMSAPTKDLHKLLLYRAYVPRLTGAATLALLGGMLAAWLARRDRQLALIVLAAAGFLSGQAIMLGHEPAGRDKAGVAHLAAVQAELGPHTPIYGVGIYEYAFPFYLGRTLIMVAKAEDGMQLGLRQEPHLWIPTLDGFVAAWTADHARGRKALALMRPDIYADLRKLGVPMRVIREDPRRIIVTNEVQGQGGCSSVPGCSFLEKNPS